MRGAASPARSLGLASVRSALTVAAVLACIAAGTAQAEPPPVPPAEYQAAIRQLAAGAAEDAQRTAQLRMTLGQVEAQRDAALARVKELEKAAAPPAEAPAK